MNSSAICHSLSELLQGIQQLPERFLGAEVMGLTMDSRHVKPGFIFFAVKGGESHRLDFSEQALRNGAIAILCDQSDATGDRIDVLPSNVKSRLISVTSLSTVMGIVADRFYGKPSSALNVIACTGTNGKSSTCHYLCLAYSGIRPCALIGTLGWGYIDDLQATPNTTPNCIELQAILAQLKSKNTELVAMEASSHGLAQGRLEGIDITGAIFTNISRDHLDYHSTMEAYLDAKLKLLRVPGLRFVVLNLDDAIASEVFSNLPQSVQVYGFSQGSRVCKNTPTIYASQVVCRLHSLEFDVQYQEMSGHISVPLIGALNVENLLAVLATMIAMGVPFTQAVAGLNRVTPLKGRLQAFGGGDLPHVVVDYAHTPEALDRVLRELKPLASKRLIVVFGCGGDRDCGKRSLMGEAASRWCDSLILTDDNPRSEDPVAIVNDILLGCDHCNPEIIHDRRKAIFQAICAAEKDDLIVIAGKGHETQQIIKGKSYPFSDQQVVEEALHMRSKGMEARIQ